MSRLRRVIREVHRRSLWQVLAIYLAGSWVALQVVESLTESAGLPDWVPSFALVLLILGLPMCLATAFVQEGVGSGDEGAAAGDGAPPTGHRSGAGATSGAVAGEAAPGPSAGEADGGTRRSGLSSSPVDDGLRHTLFTWKNAVIGGLAAFTLLAVAVAVYFFMWSAGVGPVGSLVAQGVLDEREQVVLADFSNATPDSLLGGVVTEALRVDLLESPVLTVVDPSFTQQVLRRMRRDPSTRMTADVAREVAQRSGLKAVIQGEVGSAGEGYVLTARLVEAGSGSTLAAFRETADDDGELIAAIDKLSQRIREKAGESLRSIKGGEALQSVTTTSLDALRKYTQGTALGDRGELERAIDVMEEAVALDSTFAMAWRKLAVLMGNAGRGGPEADSALARAYRLRDRLTDRERYAAIAHYHFEVTDSLGQTERAYRNLLDLDPDNRIALNNLGLLLIRQDDHEGALEYLERAVHGPGESSVAHLNRVASLRFLGRFDESRSAAERYRERYPEDFRWAVQATRTEASAESFDEAVQIAEDGLERFDTDLARRSFNHLLGELAIAGGRLEEAADHYEAMVEADPEAADHALRDMAEARVILGDTAGARARLRRAFGPGGALADVPEDEWDWTFLVNHHARMGDEAAFDDMWARAMENLPSDVSEADVRQARAMAEAHLAVGEGRWAEAVERMEAVRRERDCGACYLPELGIALAEAGRTEEAIAAVEEWLGDHAFHVYHAAFDGVLLERLGPLYEDVGDTARALDAYTRLVARWRDADPWLQPRVEAARARVDALGGSPSGTE